MTSLRHANLVRLFELQNVEGSWFYTMELVEGTDLVTALSTTKEGKPGTPTFEADEFGRTLTATSEGELSHTSGRVFSDGGRLDAPASSLEELRAAMQQLLSALSFLHHRGIVHRDLKPDNILLKPDGTLILLDFGIAKALEGGQHTGSTGDIIGTVSYMSPEQGRGQAATPASDLYAVGCILYELLSGSLPFRGNNMELLMAHQSQAPVPLEQRVGGVPPELAELCLKLLSKDPAARPEIPEIRAKLGLTEEARQDHELFVGRERELQRLSGELDRTEQSKQPLFWMIRGASGVGKSRLAQALITTASRRGFQVLRSRCFERELMPFQAFDEIMDGLALSFCRWKKKELAPLFKDLAQASLLFPAFSLVFETCKTTPPALREQMTKQEQYQAASFSMIKLLKAQMASQPLLLVLEDLQWIDRDSVDVLERFLSREAELQGLFLLGTCRPVDEQTHALHAHLGAPFEALELEGLAPESIELLLEQVLPPLENRRDFARRCHDQTEGNAFFVMQLLHLLKRSDQSVLTAYPGIHTMIRERFAQLSALSIELLGLASLCGGTFSRELMWEASSGEGQAFDDGFDALLQHRLWLVTEKGDFDFYHDKYREYAEASLEEGPRKAYHRALALAKTELGSSAMDVVGHWRAAGEHEAYLEATRAAAEEAKQALVFRKAEEFYRVLEQAAATDEERLPILKELAALYRTGREPLLELELQRELQGLVHTPHEQLEVRTRIGHCLDYLNRHSEAFEWHVQLMEEQGMQNRQTLDLRTILLLVWLRLQLVFWTTFIPHHWFRREVDAESLARLHFLYESTEFFQDKNMFAAAECMLGSLLLGRRLQDNAAIHRQYAFLPILLAASGSPDLKRCDRWLSEAHRLALEHGSAWELALTEMARGMVLLHHDLKGAAETFEDAIALMKENGYQDRWECMGTLIWKLRAEVYFDPQSTLQQLKRILGPWSGPDARRSFGEGLRLVERNVLFVTVVEVCCHRGDFELDAIWEAWQRDIEQYHAPVSTSLFWSTVSRVHFENARGRFDEAIGILEQREGILRERGYFLNKGRTNSRWWQVYCEATLGRLLQGKALTSTQAKKLSSYASLLAGKGTSYHRSMGSRALALLAHQKGEPAVARSHCRAAIEDPFLPQVLHDHWLCLRTAEVLGVELSQDQRAKMEALEKEHQFKDNGLLGLMETCGMRDWNFAHRAER